MNFQKESYLDLYQKSSDKLALKKTFIKDNNNNNYVITTNRAMSPVIDCALLENNLKDVESNLCKLMDSEKEIVGYNLNLHHDDILVNNMNEIIKSKSKNRFNVQWLNANKTKLINRMSHGTSNTQTDNYVDFQSACFTGNEKKWLNVRCNNIKNKILHDDSFKAKGFNNERYSCESFDYLSGLQNETNVSTLVHGANRDGTIGSVKNFQQHSKNILTPISTSSSASVDNFLTISTSFNGFYDSKLNCYSDVANTKGLIGQNNMLHFSQQNRNLKSRSYFYNSKKSVKMTVPSSKRQILEEEFRKEKYPSNEKLQKISAKLNMRYDEVQNYFKKRRREEKETNHKFSTLVTLLNDYLEQED